jgi:uncharacterized membrane protein YidH (DUF202 family)
MSDTWIGSLLWGRVGAAILTLAAVVLAGFGIEFGADTQSEVYGAISAVLAGIGAVMAVVSKLREKHREKAMGQSGQSAVLIVYLMMAIMAIVLASGIMLAGCAPHQSATQQLREQTDDSAIIALGTYADALEAYITAQELYLPNQEYIKATRPELDNEIIKHFREARRVRTLWKKVGVVSPTDKEAFRLALRAVMFEVALMIDQKGKVQ